MFVTVINPLYGQGADPWRDCPGSRARPSKREACVYDKRPDKSRPQASWTTPCRGLPKPYAPCRLLRQSGADPATNPLGAKGAGGGRHGRCPAGTAWGRRGCATAARGDASRSAATPERIWAAIREAQADERNAAGYKNPGHCGTSYFRRAGPDRPAAGERVVIGPAGADIRLRVEGLASLVHDLGAISPGALRAAA